MNAVYGDDIDVLKCRKNREVDKARTKLCY